MYRGLPLSEVHVSAYSLCAVCTVDRFPFLPPNSVPLHQGGLPNFPLRTLLSERYSLIMTHLYWDNAKVLYFVHGISVVCVWGGGGFSCV